MMRFFGFLGLAVVCAASFTPVSYSWGGIDAAETPRATNPYQGIGRQAMEAEQYSSPGVKSVVNKMPSAGRTSEGTMAEQAKSTAERQAEAKAHQNAQDKAKKRKENCDKLEKYDKLMKTFDESGTDAADMADANASAIKAAGLPPKTDIDKLKAELGCVPITAEKPTEGAASAGREAAKQGRSSKDAFEAYAKDAGLTGVDKEIAKKAFEKEYLRTGNVLTNAEAAALAGKDVNKAWGEFKKKHPDADFTKEELKETFVERFNKEAVAVQAEKLAADKKAAAADKADTKLDEKPDTKAPGTETPAADGVPLADNTYPVAPGGNPFEQQMGGDQGGGNPLGDLLGKLTQGGGKGGGGNEGDDQGNNNNSGCPAGTQLTQINGQAACVGTKPPVTNACVTLNNKQYCPENDCGLSNPDVIRINGLTYCVKDAPTVPSSTTPTPADLEKIGFADGSVLRAGLCDGTKDTRYQDNADYVAGFNKGKTECTEVKLPAQAAKDGYANGFAKAGETCGKTIPAAYTDNKVYLEAYTRGVEDCRNTPTTTPTTSSTTPITDPRLADEQVRTKCADQLVRVALELQLPVCLVSTAFRTQAELATRGNQCIAGEGLTEADLFGFDGTRQSTLLRAKTQFNAGKTDQFTANPQDVTAARDGLEKVYLEGFACARKL